MIFTEKKSLPLYKEVFIVSSSFKNYNEDEIEVYQSVEELLTSMNEIDVEAEELPIIIHGVITPATVIPTIASGQRHKFLLVYDEVFGTGTITEANDMDYEAIADEINCMINDLKYSNDPDEIFIIYGYKLRLVFSIDEEGIDDEEITYCKKVGDIAEQLSNGLEE